MDQNNRPEDREKRITDSTKGVKKRGQADDPAAGTQRAGIGAEYAMPLIILTGPTAVGKTDLSVRLAKALGGEIISADSMQVYCHMDIGSAKVTKEEMDGVPHHLIDVLKPDQEGSVPENGERSPDPDLWPRAYPYCGRGDGILYPGPCV